MPFNTKDDIKRKLALPPNDSTISDNDIDTYLTEAEEQLYSTIRRNFETDRHRVTWEPDGEQQNIFTLTMGNVDSIQEVRRNGEVVNSSDYSLDPTLKDRITYTGDLNYYDVLDIHYVPKIYAHAELYIALVEILARIRPMSEEDDPVYRDYKKRRDHFIKTIKSRMTASWTI